MLLQCTRRHKYAITMYKAAQVCYYNVQGSTSMLLQCTRRHKYAITMYKVAQV